MIENFSAEIPAGQRVAIIGQSGSGKTTLLRTIAGLHPASSGEIEIEGHIPSALFGTGRLQFLHQRAALWEHLTIEGNLKLSHRLNLHKELSAEHCSELIGGLGLKGSELKYPFELSEGMRARVALARLFVSPPQIALLDEPFASLDPSRRDNLNTALVALAHRHRTTVVMVTHDVVEALRFSDRVVVFSPIARTPSDIPLPSIELPLDPNQLPADFLALRDELYGKMNG